MLDSLLNIDTCTKKKLMSTVNHVIFPLKCYLIIIIILMILIVYNTHKISINIT
jgi:hypothetical protein